ncbi:hypothetical protein JCM10908_001707 [Rhodotorula pacifica]|uniref:uncharacterized protein n=1 Tax=Rhodotorula pacifica TaxID=1495444 RepID=UPI0031779373
MSSLDLNRLFQAHTILSCLASLSDAPVWNPVIGIVGLVLVPTLQGADGAGSDGARHFVSVLGGSIVLDFFWFTSHSTHGLSRVFILVNWLLKLVTLINLNSQLQARGHAGGFNFPGGMGAGGFSIPGGLSDRFASVFPPVGGNQQGQAQQQQQAGRETSETVWSAPGSYQQTRFSLDEEGSIGSMTPPVTVSGVHSPLGESKAAAGATTQAQAPPQYSAGSSGAGGGKGGRTGGKTGGAEGGGYHTLE